MPGTTTPEAPGIPAEISSSLGTVWKNYSGERPAAINTTIRDTKVVCVMDGAVGLFDAGLKAAASADAEPTERQLTMETYRRDAIEAVSRATRRRVVALISKRDKKTDVAKETFIVDSPPMRARSIFIDRQGGEE